MTHLFLMWIYFKTEGPSLTYMYLHVQIFLACGSIVLLLQGNDPFQKLKKLN